MSSTRRLIGGPNSGSWLARLGLFLAGAVALLLTIGIVIAGFFIGLTLLGLAALAALVFWIRRRWLGIAPRPSMRRSTREPVIIDGEFVVLAPRGRSGSSQGE